MKKLRIVFAGVLLSLPLMVLSAAPVTKDVAPAGLNGTHSVTGWCYIYFAGRYWLVPC
jgi:hypothetical protein